MGDQRRECGGQVSDRRRPRRVQRLPLEKDALSFLHPRVVLHQLWVQERILRDDVLYPLDQAVCGESRDQRSVLISEGIHRGESLDQRNTALHDFCLAYLQHDIIIGRGRAAVRVALAGFTGCSSVVLAI